MNPNKEKNQREGDAHLLGHQVLEVDHQVQEVRPIEELNIHRMTRMIRSNIEIRNQKVPKNQKYSLIDCDVCCMYSFQVEMPPDPLVARAGSKFDSVTGPRDRWMAEHPYKPEWHQEEQARRKAEYGHQPDMTMPGGQDPRIPQGFRGGPNPFRGGFRGGRGGGRGRGDPRNHPSNQGDIASRR